MVKKPIIAIDIDDVLADENSTVMAFINEKYSLSLTRADYDIDGQYWGYWEKVWQVSDEEGARRFEAYLNSGVKAEQQVLGGAIEAIANLKKKFDLIIITARDDKQVKHTKVWLMRHFPNVFGRVEFVHVWSGNNKASKADIATKLGAEYLIDDNAEHCRLASEAGITALLFGDYGWNRSEATPEGVIRVNNWEAITNYFSDERTK